MAVEQGKSRTQGETIVRERTQIKIPAISKSTVILYNDDVTTFDFVTDMLMDIFEKDYEEARDLTMKVHVEGAAKVGSYPHEIAETMVSLAISKARAEGFPLRCEIER